MQIDQAVARIARRAQIHLVFVDGGGAAAHLIDQRQQWTAEGHQVAQQMAPQQRNRDFEKRFRRHVGVGDLAVRGDHDHRMRQRIEYRVGGDRGKGGRHVETHAGALQPKAS
jgi:hypothetical protein